MCSIPSLRSRHVLPVAGLQWHSFQVKAAFCSFRKILLLRTVSLTCLAILFGLEGFAQFNQPDYKPDMLVANNDVRAVARSGNTIYIGGNFSHLDPYTGCGVNLSTNTDQLTTTPLQINGLVRTSIPDGSGGWYIGGAFTSIGGVTRN